MVTRIITVICLMLLPDKLKGRIYVKLWDSHDILSLSYTCRDERKVTGRNQSSSLAVG